ncbi:MAG: flavin reductase family protein [Betaproteobacteria bacterium]
MKKTTWPPGNLLAPVPAVLVSCQGPEGPPNVLTVAWTGTVCSEPPMLSISLQRQRHSYELIKETGEFVVNLPPERLAFVTDFCGVVSGRTTDKFAALRLTPLAASAVKPPLIGECPVNLECRVEKILPLGSHDLLLARIVAVDVDEDLVTPAGRLNLSKAHLLAYVHGEYWSLKKPLGRFGFSVRKRRRGCRK